MTVKVTVTITDLAGVGVVGTRELEIDREAKPNEVYTALLQPLSILGEQSAARFVKDGVQ